MTTMHVARTVLEASHRLASEVSHEALTLIVASLENQAQATLSGWLTQEAASLFEELQRTWHKDAPQLTRRELGCLLRGAAHAVERERESRRVELVWSGPTAVSSTFRSTGPALLELIEGSRQLVYLVTFAAYRVPAVATALDAAMRRGVRVVFVLESDDSGKVSFDPLASLSAGGASTAEVFCWPQHKRKRDERGRHGTLHAKFAVADRQHLLVSSANLTEFAFELNIELGVLLTGGAAAGAATDHLESLIRTGVLQRQSA